MSKGSTDRAAEGFVMSTEGPAAVSKRPARGMATANFSLLPRHIEAIREAAQREGVSQSEIVRRAVELALNASSPRPGAPNGPPGRRGQTVLAPVVKELATIRRELGLLRDAITRLEEPGASKGGWQPGARPESNHREPALADW
jgi:hypothetical protein